MSVCSSQCRNAGSGWPAAAMADGLEVSVQLSIQSRMDLKLSLIMLYASALELRRAPDHGGLPDARRALGGTACLTTLVY